MTIQLPVSSSNVACEPAVIAMDFARLGAEVFDGDSEWGDDFPVEQCNFSRLGTMTRLAMEDGLDSIVLGPSFFLRSDTHLRESRLDAFHAVFKLQERIRGTITAAIEGDPYIVRAALEARGDTPMSLEIYPVEEHFDAIVAELATARRSGVTVTIALDEATLAWIDLDTVARLADTVRLRIPEVNEAIRVRHTIQESATRSITILADVYVIVSSCAMDAEERGELISMIGVDRYADGAPRILGTVHDVADHIETWTAAGAADGFVILPGSLPTDLASIVRGVLPLMEARRAAERDDAEYQDKIA